MDARPPAITVPCEVIEDLANSLQVLALLSKAFECELADTRWAQDARRLQGAAQHAVQALSRITPRRSLT